MLARPQPSEAAPYYSKYIDLVPTDDVVAELETQLDQTLDFLSGISEEKSLHRYAPEKWSIREVLSHMNDCERVFVFRAFWFARGFSDPLPSFDQEICVKAAAANDVSWASHVEEFRVVRLASLSFFRNLPAEAWERTGIASDNSFTVRALAYILAGHVTHHIAVIRDRYL
ncbi:MAG TPA: DinB family protein [Pyrinomonadaceae bacterium]|jgi:uncharacterized damage-inducible protein DinB